MTELHRSSALFDRRTLLAWVLGGLAGGLGAGALALSSFARRPARLLARELPRLHVVPLTRDDLEVDHELAG